MRVLYIQANHYAVKFYRGDVPLERLRHLGPVEVIYPTGDNLVDVNRADVVFFMRTTDEKSYATLRQARSMGRPVWYDLDDDYLAVTPDSPAFEYYQRTKTKDLFSRFLNDSDVRTFSTQALMDRYGREGDVVIPNAIDDYALPMCLPEGERDLIVWRGGGSHMADLYNMRNAIGGVINEGKSKFAFLGYNPWFITLDGEDKLKPNVSCYSYSMDYYSYMSGLRDLKPKAIFAPLVKNQFNLCKSNIAALEGIWAGAVPIVPDFPEWQIPGALRYDDQYDLAACIEEVASYTQEQVKEANAKAQYWMQARVLTFVNKQRLDLLKRLTRG